MRLIWIISGLLFCILVSPLTAANTKTKFVRKHTNTGTLSARDPKIVKECSQGCRKLRDRQKTCYGFSIPVGGKDCVYNERSRETPQEFGDYYHLEYHRLAGGTEQCDEGSSAYTVSDHSTVSTKKATTTTSKKPTTVSVTSKKSTTAKGTTTKKVTTKKPTTAKGTSTTKVTTKKPTTAKVTKSTTVISKKSTTATGTKEVTSKVTTEETTKKATASKATTKLPTTTKTTTTVKVTTKRPTTAKVTATTKVPTTKKLTTKTVTGSTTRRGEYKFLDLAFNGSLFYFDSADSNNAQCQTICNSRGMNVTSVHSKNETDFIKSTLCDNFFPTSDAECLPALHLGSICHLGIRFPSVKSKEWIFTDGTPSDYFNSNETMRTVFSFGEGGECVHMRNYGDWNDIDCGAPAKCVCRKKLP